MHLGKFHALVTSLNVEYKKKEVGAKIENVIREVEALAANPGNSDVANNFRSQLEELRSTLSKSKLNKPYPTLAKLIEAIDAENYIGDRLFDKIEGILAKNGMTPQLAAGELRKFFSEVGKFYTEINAVDQAFTHLGVEYEILDRGDGEIGISIPEPQGERLLADLAASAKSWNKALRPFVELADPEHNPIVVRTISSSDWQFYLASVPAVYLALSTAISQLNELLQKLVETRKLIAQLTERGVSADGTAMVAAEADNMLDRGTRALAEQIVDENPPADIGRANELKTELTGSLKFIALELAKNVTIEVRYLPPPPPKPESPEFQDDEAKGRLEFLTQTAAQIERNMELVRLEPGVQEILNLPAPDEDKD
ncbi:hypothetical protein IP92_01394 [Pseudoduganella flava]|uniref:Uncharacterized protein n=1 Tax=Pseudoduganella flava TaxID=871742 RepID=A0A562Q0F2_9BURK|nr:hypothetical protein [Pseudoduganella flava]QGZ38299.1 hypothetical protein GO485_04025 [Pseudoduganella flava]TWI50165.1 hypothetical protein IP92_01394 [Pseudoduganella flava]